MTTAQIEMYADLYCPYAYLAAYRLRRLREEYAGRVEVAHRSLALEYVNREPTPKRVLDIELPMLMLEEPDIPYQPWAAPDSEWPVTMWPPSTSPMRSERSRMTRVPGAQACQRPRIACPSVIEFMAHRQAFHYGCSRDAGAGLRVRKAQKTEMGSIDE